MPAPLGESEFLPVEVTRDPVLADPSASPFKLVVDPEMRMKLRRALLEIVETHDEELAKYVSEGMLSLETCKEYIEIFARNLRENMGTREGIAYLLRACGFEVNLESINLQAETRWKVER